LTAQTHKHTWRMLNFRLRFCAGYYTLHTIVSIYLVYVYVKCAQITLIIVTQLAGPSPQDALQDVQDAT